MKAPVVDVVIPVHSEHRPIARAVSSVLLSASENTRVTVVCHNIRENLIAANLGGWEKDPRVRLMTLEDGVQSPAGPLNAGLDSATAEFTAILGSDDEYEPGAINAWLAVARRDLAEIVIPPLRSAPGGATKSPPTRPWRSRQLDGVRDRLAYRTVQLGLVSRERFGHVRMSEGLRTGEDVVQGASLWYSDASISLARGMPGYLIHDDNSPNRMSSSPKPALESLLFLDSVLNPSFLAALNPRQKESFAVKLLRTHIMDILSSTLIRNDPTPGLTALSQGVTRILEIAPASLRILSRRESRIVGELVSTANPERLKHELAILTDYRRIDNLLPASPRFLLHREAPPRFLAAIAFMG